MYELTFAPQSNQADWTLEFELLDDSGASIDLTGKSFRVSVEDAAGRQVLAGSTSDGVILLDADDGVLTWRFDAAAMRALCAGTYRVGLVMAAGSDTEQVLLGSLPIVQGLPR